MRTRLSPRGRRVGKGMLGAGAWAGVIALLLTGAVKACTAVGSTVSSALERARERAAASSPPPQAQMTVAPATVAAPASQPADLPRCQMFFEDERVVVHNLDRVNIQVEGVVRVTLQPEERMSMIPSHRGVEKWQGLLTLTKQGKAYVYLVDFTRRTIELRKLSRSLE